MREYHFLISSLPELFFDKKGMPIDFQSYITELETHLHPDDFKTVCLLRYEIDNINLLNLVSENNKPFLHGGNFSHNDLKQELKNPAKLPSYLIEFLDYHKQAGIKKNQAENEKHLFGLYYPYVLGSKVPFLETWFAFELALKNIATAIISNKLETKPENSMLGEKAQIEEILFHMGKNFDLGHILPNYQKLVQAMNQKDILEREKQIDQFKWDFLNELTLFNYFTIEVILSYTLKLKILERWENINAEKGEKMLDKILTELQDSDI